MFLRVLWNGRVKVRLGMLISQSMRRKELSKGYGKRIGITHKEVLQQRLSLCCSSRGPRWRCPILRRCFSNFATSDGVALWRGVDEIGGCGDEELAVTRLVKLEVTSRQ